MRASDFLTVAVAQGVAEAKKKKKKKSSRAMGGYFFPGYGYYVGGSEGGGDGGGGVAEGLLEAREGTMREIIRKTLPTWPEYVIKDWISSRVKNQEDLKNLTGWLVDLNKMVEPNSWKLHQKMFLTFDMLNPRTRYSMKTKRQFGARNPFLIPRDEERNANAEQLVKTKGMENLPPVIMIQHSNGLELCEGWHRTMAAFRLNPEGFYVNAWIGQAGQQGVAEVLNKTTAQLGPQLYAPHPKNLDESMKPRNALWTSTASGDTNGYTSAWVQWAESEMPQWIGQSGFLYDVSPSARILTINSDQDALIVAKKYGLNTTNVMDLFMYMPWNKIAKDYDAIHHVPSNRGADLFMHAWDVESTAWFNTNMLLNKRKVPIATSKTDLTEGTYWEHVPNEDWLQEKIDYARSRGRNSYGVPHFGSTTASVRGTPFKARVMRLASLPGTYNEQNNVRKKDLEWLMDYMGRTGRLPPATKLDPNEEHLPHIMVAYNGEAWVTNGSHRIMAAYRLNWQTMPIEINYFDGGERIESGPMYPGKIGLK